MVDWAILPVTFRPKNTCCAQPAKKEQCIKAARAVLLRWESPEKPRVTRAVVRSPWHTSGDKKNHVTVSFFAGKKKIDTLHAYFEDVVFAYGAEAFY